MICKVTLFGTNYINLVEIVLIRSTSNWRPYRNSNPETRLAMRPSVCSAFLCSAAALLAASPAYAFAPSSLCLARTRASSPAACIRQLSAGSRSRVASGRGFAGAVFMQQQGSELEKKVSEVELKHALEEGTTIAGRLQVRYAFLIRSSYTSDSISTHEAFSASG